MADAPMNLADPALYEPEAALDSCNYTLKLRKNESRKCNNKATLTDNGYLPYCKTHRYKPDRARAGRCRGQYTSNGQTQVCGRLFSWRPPYFELCALHKDSPVEDCHFMKIPPELRLQIYRYLIPDEPVTARLNVSQTAAFQPIARLMSVSRQVSAEAEDLFYATTPFNVYISKEGIYMANRWIIQSKTDTGEPSRVIPYAPFDMEQIKSDAARFKSDFDRTRVRHYNVNIALDQGADCATWDSEVEAYDMRDYVGWVVTQFLSTPESLRSLKISLAIVNYRQDDLDMTLRYVKRILEPFERLRNVRNVKMNGLWYSEGPRPAYQLHQPNIGRWDPEVEFLHSENQATHEKLDLSRHPKQKETFDDFVDRWAATIMGNNAPPLESPLRAAFSEFKRWYGEAVSEVPILRRNGRESLLHRARMAREQHDTEEFQRIVDETAQSLSNLFEGSLKETRLQNILKAEQHRARLQTEHQDMDALHHRLIESIARIQETITVSRGGPTNLRLTYYVMQTNARNRVQNMTENEKIMCSGALDFLPEQLQVMKRSEDDTFEAAQIELQRQVRELQARIEDERRKYEDRWLAIACHNQTLAMQQTAVSSADTPTARTDSGSEDGDCMIVDARPVKTAVDQLSGAPSESSASFPESISDSTECCLAGPSNAQYAPATKRARTDSFHVADDIVKAVVDWSQVADTAPNASASSSSSSAPLIIIPDDVSSYGGNLDTLDHDLYGLPTPPDDLHERPFKGKGKGKRTANEAFPDNIDFSNR